MTLPDNQTYGERYGPAMEIIDQAKADEYFEALVQQQMRFHGGNKSREQIEKDERLNLGYYSGYYSRETSERVKQLYKAPHPIFDEKVTTY